MAIPLQPPHMFDHHEDQVYLDHEEDQHQERGMEQEVPHPEPQEKAPQYAHNNAPQDEIGVHDDVVRPH